MSPLHDGLRADLTAALRDAMRARDRVATAVLRSVLGEIGNAEAVPADSVPAVPPVPDPPTAAAAAAVGRETSRSPGTSAPESHIAGAVAGVGSTEVARRELTDADVEAIVRAEIDERRRAADEYRSLGRNDEATGLDAEADVLDSLLG